MHKYKYIIPKVLSPRFYPSTLSTLIEKTQQTIDVLE